MPEFLVKIEHLKVYKVLVKAPDPEEAEERAGDMLDEMLPEPCFESFEAVCIPDEEK